MQCEGGGLLSGRWALLESRANEQTSHPERADGKGKGRVKLYGGKLQAKSVAVKCWNMSGWSVGAREAKVRLKRWVSCQPWSSGICWTKLVEQVGSWTNLERMGSWNDLGQAVFTCHGHAWVLRTTSQWKQTSWSKDVLHKLKQFYSTGRSCKALWSKKSELHCEIVIKIQWEITIRNCYSKLVALWNDYSQFTKKWLFKFALLDNLS